MPNLNGRELARRLVDLNPQLACVFTSGYTADIVARRGVLDEGMHFLQKPFAVSELAVKIQEALGGVGARG